MNKVRLDILLVERGLVASRSLAQRLIMAGEVRIDGEVILKPATTLSPNVNIEIDQGPPYVSRGGEKLAAALQVFKLDISGQICADVGASTGGFTDCLLKNGAARVFAIDVGKGILHWKLRQDERVIVMEGRNARYIDRLPEPIDLVTIDASFISLKVLLPVVKNWLRVADVPHSSGKVIALIKPQFEAGRSEAARGEGVIRDPVVHERILQEVLKYAECQGYSVRGWIQSPLEGPKGNIEFLAWLSYANAVNLPTLDSHNENT